jgi:hypothetical protein
MTEIPNLPLETEEQPEPVTTPQPTSEPTVPPIPAAEPVVEPIDYEQKFAESTREAQVLAGRVAAFEAEDARRKLTKEPTDSELQAAFPEWEVMTDTEKRLARGTFSAQRIATSLQEKEEAREAVNAWNTDLELTIAKNPSLQGKEQAFKTFANKPTHRGAPLETLVSAFLFESSPNPSAPTPTPRPGLLPGNGGPRGSEKPKLLTGDELKVLRETDITGYREYVKTHPMTELEA